jgi:hypothetical protein
MKILIIYVSLLSCTPKDKGKIIFRFNKYKGQCEGLNVASYWYSIIGT